MSDNIHPMEHGGCVGRQKQKVITTHAYQNGNLVINFIKETPKMISLVKGRQNQSFNQYERKCWILDPTHP